jgi:CRP-like cAMP-binding protein
MRSHSRGAEARLLSLGLSTSETVALSSTSTLIDVPAGKMLLRQGQTGTQMLWIIEGSAVVVRSGEVLAHVGPSAVIGEMTVVGGRAACSVDVIAETPMTVAVQSRRDWQLLRHRAPSLATRLLDLAKSREDALAA